jgi:SNF2 family DNA or RNA helicase
VRLAGKGWRRMKFNFTAEEDEKLARLGVSPHELSNEPQRFHALQLADEAARRFLPAEQAAEVSRRAAELKARVTPTVPKGVTAELRSYQLEGFHFLAYLATNRFGGILADDMGLGKTLQTLTWLLWLRQECGDKKPNPSLVVCPKSVMDNWQSEAGRFTPGLRVRKWGAADLAGMPTRWHEADLHVLNYAQLRSLGDGVTRLDWHAVILDEGQIIKNPASQTAQIACALRASHRLVLSGTPIENRLLDLWSLFAFAMPGVLGTRARFNQIYDAKSDSLARRRLSARVRPFLLRRTKNQVAKELPPRIEEDLLCELEGAQEQLYRAELKRAQQILLKIATDKELAKERFHLLTSLLRLRQICCHPALLLGDGSAPREAKATAPEKKGPSPAPADLRTVKSANSAKLEALMETLEPIMEEGSKVLVFSQFLGLFDLVRLQLKDRQWPVYELTGATENRGELVQKFQAHDGAAVFLISLKAGGAGLNLTAASYVVLFDPWWNPAVENQAIDRTHRIGQTQQVIAYRLLMKDTIEEKIRALQKTKGALADDVLGEEKFAQSLTLKDLKFLLAD